MSAHVNVVHVEETAGSVSANYTVHFVCASGNLATDDLDPR